MDTVDYAQRTKLEGLRSNLEDVLKLMQKSANNEGYKDIFGRKDEDIIRLQEIPDEYARIVQTMSVYAERAASKEPLPGYVKSDIQQQLAHANTLVAEYHDTLTRFQCALQKNC